MLLLLLHACAGPTKGPPVVNDSNTGDSGGTDTDDPDDTDTDDTDPDDTGAPLADGDNLVRLGAWMEDEERTLVETTGVLALDATTVAMCMGAQTLATFDLTDPAAPVRLATVPLPRPAGGFRCQHLATTGDGRLLVAHHGDETGPSWLGLADVRDPAAPIGLAAWAGPAVERVAAAGNTAWVAAHEDGLLRFDLSVDTLDLPEPVLGVTGNVYAVAHRAGRVAVGTVEGSLFLVDGDVVTGPLALSGPVRDLAWLDDGALVAACGSDGLDRVDVDTLTVTAHADTTGTALDVAVLSDGAVAVAGWSAVFVHDGGSLALLGAEDPRTRSTPGIALAVEAFGDALLVGEWNGLLSYAWDPTVSAPEVRIDATRFDFGAVAAGEVDALTVVLRNDGPKPLTITGLSVADTAVTVDRAAFTIPAGGADFAELTWSSTGGPLSTALTFATNDPDEPTVTVSVGANRVGTGLGEMVPAFSYTALDSADVYTSQALGQPALLSYFATY